MDLETTVRVLFGGSGETVIRECRRCGTTVDPGTDSCPECGTSEIATYRV